MRLTAVARYWESYEKATCVMALRERRKGSVCILFSDRESRMCTLPFVKPTAVHNMAARPHYRSICLVVVKYSVCTSLLYCRSNISIPRKAPLGSKQQHCIMCPRSNQREASTVLNTVYCPL